MVTFDWENVPAEALDRLARRTRIAPPLLALATAQDRLLEKQLFARLRIPTNRNQRGGFARGPASAPPRDIGLPGVLKTRRLGYDGKGQQVLRKPADLEAAWQALGSAPLLYEDMVPFDYEVSAIGVRGQDGEFAMYPLNRNLHQDGILRLTRAPWKSAAAGSALPGARCKRVHGAFRLRRRADHRVLRAAAAGCWPTRWRRGCTTPGTGPSKGR